MELEDTIQRAQRALVRFYPRAHIAPADWNRWHAHRIVPPQERGPAANAYRMLRTQVLRQARASQARTIGIVSAAGGEGKTLTAVNLALSLAAEPNQTVLLVDLDLHRPGVAALLDLPAERGVEECLAGTGSVAGCFWRIQGIERLSVLPAFTHPAAGSEVLAGVRVKELLHELRARYEDRLILIDLPPALLNDAVLNVAPLLDAVLIVGCEGRTRRDDLARLREMLRGLTVLGTVLNCATDFERRAY